MELGPLIHLYVVVVIFMVSKLNFKDSSINVINTYITHTAKHTHFLPYIQIGARLLEPFGVECFCKQGNSLI